MKKIYSILCLSAVLFLSGCSDYLSIKPRGSEVAYKLEHYEGLIYGEEMFMMDESFPYMCFEFTTDEEGYSNVYSILGTSVCNSYKWSDDILREEEVCGEWNTHTKILYSLNIVVNEVMDAVDGTEDERLAIQSEARVLRAWHTFMMAQYFGKPYNASTASTDLCVPIITKASTTGNEFPRETVQKVYDFVLSEMEESVPYLQDREEHFLRVFKATGYAMLGKVYWMKGDYEKATDNFEVAMSSLDKYQTTGFLDYNTMVDENGEINNFPVDDTQNPEFIYNFNTMSLIWIAMYPSYYSSILLGLKTDVLKKYYAGDDIRLAFISGLKSGKTAYSSFKSSDRYYTNMSNFVTNLGITVPDLYLMYSESLARTGKISRAKELLYELRKNRMSEKSAGVPEMSQDELVKMIVAERMREYLGYGNSWYDMRRLWNDPLFEDMKQYYTHSVGAETYTLSEKRLTMRIPPQVMAWHPEYVDNE